MTAMLLISRLILSSVLLLAGITKLSDLAGFRQALLGFGVSPRFAPALGTVLPVIEILLGLALIPAASAAWAAAGALSLFLLFLAAVGYNLARGRRPDCHCFGQLHSRPISAATLVRNGALLVLAAAVASTPAPTWSSLAVVLHGSSPVLLGVILLLAGLLAAEGWLLLSLARQQGRLLLRLDDVEARLHGAPVAAPKRPATPRGLPVGAPAPAFALPSLEGPTVSLDQLREAGRAVLIVSVDPGCGPCAALLPEIAEWQRTHAGALTVAVLTRGSPEANRRNLQPHGISRVLLQRKQEVAERYEAVATPSAIIVDGDGRIALPLAAGAEEIRHMVERTVGAPSLLADGLPVGAPAPAIRLSDLEGKPFDLEARIGEPTVVLFWNPACGFCQQMLPELRAREAERLGDTGLVLLSSGTAEANQGMELRSRVLLDEGFTVGRCYGASGTPSAVLVDAAGRVASPLTVGASNVMALLDRLELHPEDTSATTHSTS